jgi:GAF domain-containing protein
MTEDLTISGETKKEIYSSLLPQIKALIGNETDLVANLANVAAALKEGFHFLMK